MENCITNDPVLMETALMASRNVIDPEIQLNVVDLGLIYQIDFDKEGKKLFCSMTLTTRFCPMGSTIKSDVERCLSAAFPQFCIVVDLVFDPPWNRERITEPGKEFLNR